MSNDKTLRKLSGKWSMNKGRSSDVTPVLEIQGFNLIMRKAAAAAPITLTITQDSPDEIHITQSTTASIPALKVSASRGPARTTQNREVVACDSCGLRLCRPARLYLF